MTDRINSLTIVLENDVRSDQIEPLLTAIRQLRCVLTVKENITDVSDYVAQERARHKIKEELWKAYQAI